VAILHQRILLLLPVVSGAADRIRILRDASGITAPLRTALDRMSVWIRSGRDADLSDATALHADIDALEPPIDASSDWKAVVLVGLLTRLRGWSVHGLGGVMHFIGRNKMADFRQFSGRPRGLIGRNTSRRRRPVPVANTFSGQHLALSAKTASIFPVGCRRPYHRADAWFATLVRQQRANQRLAIDLVGLRPPPPA
jgi:hypothetical protein